LTQNLPIAFGDLTLIELVLIYGPFEAEHVLGAISADGRSNGCLHGFRT
jgi:hypothetical protein